MRNAFKASRLVGLLVLLSGLMAFGASAAHGEGTWLSSGVAITGNTSVNAKIDTHVTLLVKVGLSKVEILCSKIKLVGANLQVGGLGSGKAHFDECTTLLNGVPAIKCVPRSPSSAPHGLIETNALDGSLRLHTLEGGAKDELYEVLATAGPIVDLFLGLGECAIGNLCEITGKIFLKDSNGQLLVDLKEHLFAEGPLTELRYCGNPATIDGSAWGFLPSGNTWAGHV